MKKLLKSVCVLMTVAILFSVVAAPATALSVITATATEYGDFYAKGLIETAEIEGKTYRYHYFYDVNGNKATEITNLDTNTSELLTYNESSGIVLSDGEVVATVETLFVPVIGSPIIFPGTAEVARAGWVVEGTFDTKVTWLASTTSQALAAIIGLALLLPGIKITATMVIAAMGATTLAIILTAAKGGTVSGTAYSMYDSISYVTSLKTVFEFTIDNSGLEVYGPYTIYGTTL